MLMDYFAVGIDPEKSTVFLQSSVSETYELNLYFEMLVTVPRRMRAVRKAAVAAAVHTRAPPCLRRSERVAAASSAPGSLPVWAMR